MDKLNSEDLTNFLAHFGVKGMRWGVSQKRPPSGRSADRTAADKLAGKKVSALSNEQIKKLSTRLRLEKELSSLTPTTKSKKLFDQFMNKFSSDFIDKSASAAADVAFSVLVKAAKKAREARQEDTLENYLTHKEYLD